MTVSASRVHFDEHTMTVDLTDGRTVRVPLAWFPRLLRATPAQRAKVELSRVGLHWEELDEDISIAGLLAGQGDQTKPVKTVATEAPIAAEAKQGGRDTRVYVERRPEGDYAAQRYEFMAHRNPRPNLSHDSRALQCTSEEPVLCPT